MGARYDEIAELQKICDYCRENKEKLECEIDKLYDVMVEPGITFVIGFIQMSEKQSMM